MAVERSVEGVPCGFPLEQRAGVQLVRAQLKDAAFLAGRRSRQESKLLRKLSSPSPKKRSQCVMGLLMLSESERSSQEVWRMSDEPRNPGSSSTHCLSRSDSRTPGRGLRKE